MKRINLIKTSLLILAIVASNNPNIFAQNLSGKEIMQKVKDRPDGKNRKMKMQMELINKRDKKRNRSVVSYSMDIGKDKKSIMFFLSPADVKGTAFLTWEYDNTDKEDDRWLYLPAMKKTRRISGTSAKKDYFMGTDFTYDDMGSRNVDEDTHKRLREEKSDDYDCWVIESKPKDSKDMYSKKVSWIRKDCLFARKVEFYDKMGNLLKTLTISNIKKIDGFWTAQKMHIINHQTNHQTILLISEVQYNIEIGESLFTVSNLEKGAVK
ncbi:MAG: outer membrane lipoprotein-sorting protein [Bacteroidales bacterium]|nr:outer membrane lipoprotein-sorting protein [Bacteroidales bacterium]